MAKEDLIKVFLSEAQSQYEQLEQLLTVLEQKPQDLSIVNTIFRILHTLKANAAANDLHPISQLSHQLEDVFNEVKTGELVLDNSWFVELFKAVDKLGALLRAQSNGETVSYKGLLTKLRVKLREPSTSNVNPDLVLSEAIQGFPQSDLPNQSDASSNTAGNNIQFNETLAVPIHKLDSLLNLASEISIERDRLSTIIPNQALSHKREFKHLNRLTTELQHSILDARLIKVGTLFQKFYRVVREVSRLENKNVHLELEGSDIEMDRNILQTLSDSLVHMVRNAVSHGIESPEQREKLNKNPEGKITLSARNHKDQIIIEVRDDGRGVCVEMIKEKLRSKGWKTDIQLQSLSEEEILHYIFKPGFSSAETVSEISGRGVGMDIVKKSVDGVGGKISIRTQVGKGTCFELTLPTSMTFKPVMLFELQGLTYALPIIFLEGVCAIQASMIKSVGLEKMIDYQGNIIPFIDLAQSLHLTNKKKKALSQQVAIVVNLSGRLKAIQVDKILQQREIVEKKIPPLFNSQEIFSAACILGNGRVCLILDLNEVLKK